MKINVGDTIHVVGERGKHYTGKVSAIHPITGSEALLVEYRCDFNQGSHVARYDKCRVVKRAK